MKPPRLAIHLSIVAAKWCWLIEAEDADPDEFVASGSSGDYFEACKDALAAHDKALRKAAEATL